MYGSNLGGHFYCQDWAILADEHLKCPRRICRTKTDKEDCVLADTQIRPPAVTKASCFDYVEDVEIIFKGPGQKQMGTYGHAPFPSTPTCVGAIGRSAHLPLFLSRPILACC